MPGGFYGHVARGLAGLMSGGFCGQYARGLAGLTPGCFAGNMPADHSISPGL